MRDAQKRPAGELVLQVNGYRIQQNNLLDKRQSLKNKVSVQQKSKSEIKLQKKKKNPLRIITTP